MPQQSVRSEDRIGLQVNKVDQCFNARFRCRESSLRGPEHAMSKGGSGHFKREFLALCERLLWKTVQNDHLRRLKYVERTQ